MADPQNLVQSDPGPEGTTLSLRLFSATHTGKVRQHNEDKICVILPRDLNGPAQDVVLLQDGEFSICVVADGMGGTNSGEVAAQLAIDTITQHANTITKKLKSEFEVLTGLKELILLAHDTVLKGADHPESSGMGTTIVLVCFNQNKLFVAWSGDSRAYLFRPSGIEHRKSYDLPFLKILSDDHSIVWSRVLRGELNSDEARRDPLSNIITQSLGDPSASPSPESRVFEIMPGDRVLVCSDGLNSMLADEQIEQILQEKSPPEQTVRELIELANLAGGHDNISVIVADVVNAPPLPEKIDRPVAITAKSASGSPLGVVKNGKLSRNQLIKWVLIFSFSVGIICLLAYIFFNRQQPAQNQGGDIMGGEVIDIINLPVIMDSTKETEPMPLNMDDIESLSKMGTGSQKSEMVEIGQKIENRTQKMQDSQNDLFQQVDIKNQIIQKVQDTVSVYPDSTNKNEGGL